MSAQAISPAGNERRQGPQPPSHEELVERHAARIIMARFFAWKRAGKPVAR